MLPFCLDFSFSCIDPLVQGNESVLHVAAKMTVENETI